MAGELSESEVEDGIARSYVSSERGDLSGFLRFDVPDGPRRRGSDQSPGQQFDRPERARQGVLGERLTSPAALGQFPLPNVPFVELIHTLWLEEGMLFQTMNHILARFQNRRPVPTTRWRASTSTPCCHCGTCSGGWRRPSTGN